MRHITTLLTAAVLAGPLCGPGLVAQEPQERPECTGECARREAMRQRMQEMRQRMGERRDPMRRVAAFAPPHLLERREALGLSTEQVTRLEALAQDIKAAQEQAETEAATHREQLMAAWQQGEPDPGIVRQHAQAMMRAHQEAHLRRLEAAAGAKGLLTAEQRGRVAGWLDARQLRRDRMHRRPGGRPQRGRRGSRRPR